MPRRTDPRPIDNSEPRWAALPEASAYAKVTTRPFMAGSPAATLTAYRIGPRLLQVNLDDIDALRTRIPTRAAR